MGLNKAVYKGREVQIDLPSARDDKPSGSGGGSGGPRGGKGGGKRGKGGYDGDRGDRGGFDREDRFGDRGDRGDRERRGGGGGHGGRDREREPPSRSDFGSERPRLNLAPRTKPLPGEAGFREDQPQGGRGLASSRPDPFGGARPREDRFKPTRADGDDNWCR